MNAHVSSILLGVRAMDRSRQFYTEGLGWQVQQDFGVSVFFEPHGGSLVGFRTPPSGPANRIGGPGPQTCLKPMERPATPAARRPSDGAALPPSPAHGSGVSGP
jgi:catechol 2,3-dioxygenase-like lactoylglutathione lyase family enzyme